MKKNLSHWIIISLLLFASPSLRPSSTIQDAVRLQNPLQYDVWVTLKLIQVYVTDKQGLPVKDLKPEDFIVYDNSRKKTITEFEKYLIETPENAPEPTPTAEKAAAPAVPTPALEKLTRKYLLFFDFAYNNARGITKAKEAALHFIDTQLQPVDEIGVLSYSALKSLTLHESLTTNRRRVREAIQALGVGNGVVGLAENVEEQYWKQDFGVDENPLAPLVLENDRRLSKNQCLSFLTKMTDFAKALRYIPGKKNIVFFSSGIPGSLLYGLGGERFLGGKFDFGDHLLIDKNEQMIKELSAADCAVFAFDTRGAAKNESGFSYEAQTFGNQGRNTVLGTPSASSLNSTFTDDRLTGLYALGKIASETGGKYFGNIHEYQTNLERMKNITGSYYVLGYSIDQQWDGRYHKIKVEVTRKGLEVHAQAGYFNPKPFSEYSNLERQLHLLDLALSERSIFQKPLVFSLTPLAFPWAGDNRLQLLAKIPSRIIEKIPAQKTEIVSLILDDQDNLVRLERLEIPLRPYRGMDAFFLWGTTLPPGHYKSRLIIRDLDTGAAAVASAPVIFTAKPVAPLALFPPLLLVPEGSFAYLEPGGKQKEDLTPWKTVYPYDRAQYAPVGGDVSKIAAKIAAVIPCAVGGLIQPNIRLAAFLIDTVSGDRRPLSFSLLNKTLKENLEIYFLEAPLKDIPPGKYRLYFHAEDEISMAVAYTQTELIVR